MKTEMIISIIRVPYIFKFSWEVVNFAYLVICCVSHRSRESTFDCLSTFDAFFRLTYTDVKHQNINVFHRLIYLLCISWLPFAVYNVDIFLSNILIRLLSISKVLHSSTKIHKPLFTCSIIRSSFSINCISVLYLSCIFTFLKIKRITSWRCHWFFFSSMFESINKKYANFDIFQNWFVFNECSSNSTLLILSNNKNKMIALYYVNMNRNFYCSISSFW